MPHRSLPSCRTASLFVQTAAVFVLATATAVAVSSSAPSHTIDAVSVAIPFTTRHISINGDLSDWDSASTIEFSAHHGRGERDNSAVVKLLWDHDKLYVAFVVHDTELRGRHVSDDEHIWEDDAVEVFLDTKNDAEEVLMLSDEEFVRRGGRYEDGERKFMAPDDYHIVVNGRGTLATLRGSGLDYHDGSWEADILRAVSFTGTPTDAANIDTQYVVEMAIPWRALDVRPRSGLVLGADFGVEDVDADGRYAFDWCDAGPFTRPDTWGDIVLAGGDEQRRGNWPATLVWAAITSAALAGALGLWRIRRNRADAAWPQGSGRGAEMTERIEDCIARNYSSATLSPSIAARQLGISKRYLNMVLRQEGRPTFGNMLVRERVLRAAQLLRETDLSLAEIASSAGFRSQSAFSTMFGARTGLSPSAYRKDPSAAHRVL